MKCIFCQQERPPSEEHLIPKSLGGKLVVRNVCHQCNNRIGTKADALLTRHRHIYDAYREQRQNGGINNLTFFFDDAYINGRDGERVKLRKKDQDFRIVPTKLGERFYRIDHTDEEVVPNKLRRLGKERGVPIETVETWIRDYLESIKQANNDDAYQLPEIGFKVKKGFVHTGRRTVMKRTTPDRFIAKTCVEMVHSLGIGKEVQNLDLIRKHAIYGGMEESLTFKEDILKKAHPLHFLAFIDYQFQVYFFGKYVAGVDIEWVNGPQTICIAYDIKKGKLFICCVDREAETMRVTKDEFHLLTD